MPPICSSCALRKLFVFTGNPCIRCACALAMVIAFLCCALEAPGAREPGETTSFTAGALQDDRLPPPRALTPEQIKVENAIERGSAWLKMRLKERSNRDQYDSRIGTAALVGLTLLECGAALYDPLVEQIMTRARSEGPDVVDTYDISLIILFLDRLGRSQDSGLIRTLALRMVAAQNYRGGWSYKCQALTSDLEESLVAALQHGEKQGQQVRDKGQGGQADAEKQGQQPPEKAQADQKEAGQGAKQAKVAPKGNQGRGRANGRMPTKNMPGNAGRWDQLPVVLFSRGLPTGPQNGMDDNSNTQFATLALWVAKKHNVPVEDSLAMVEARFLHSQNPDGSWGYVPGLNNWLDSMTCAGLLGLAVGSAVDTKAEPATRKAAKKARDKGLLFVSGRVGTSPRGGGIVGANSHGDLYYLWTLERMAVVHDLTSIEGKDWYQWGSRLIVAAQSADGQWRNTFPGMPDTCFALLFLKRANLVFDLTDKLKNPGAQQGAGQPQAPQQQQPENDPTRSDAKMQGVEDALRKKK